MRIFADFLLAHYNCKFDVVNGNLICFSVIDLQKTLLDKLVEGAKEECHVKEREASNGWFG